MRVLVVGSGPAGRRHARNLLELGHEAAVARRAGVEADELSAELGVPAFAGLDAAAAWEPEAVVVANPPSAHLPAARWALGRGCPVLVEKPLAHSLDGVDELIELARDAGLHLAVGCNLRFHPALRAIEAAVASGRAGRLLAVRAEVGSYLPGWHPESDYRQGSAASAELGGGALLTLVHELDYVLWIAGEATLAAGVAARVSGLEIDADDVSEILLSHASGALGSVHVDLLDRAHNRRSRWVAELATIEWSWGGPVLLRGGEAEETLWAGPGFDPNETYRAELEAFLRGEPPPGDGLVDARRALELVAGVHRL